MVSSQQRRVKWAYIALAMVGAFALLVLRSPLRPVSWSAPPNPGFTGPYTRPRVLRRVSFLSLEGRHGPEDIAIDANGRIYVSTRDRGIVRLNADGREPRDWVDTGGRPLGLCFDRHGNLIVADAYQGLLSVAPDGAVTELVTQVEAIPIGHANAVVVADDGVIYFTDASTTFSPRRWRSARRATTLAMVEHAGDGRLLVYDPYTGRASTLLTGLHFANGVTLSHDQRSVLVAESGSYRVIRYWIVGPKTGQVEVMIDALPAFPDNISKGYGGRYWIGLVRERSRFLDRLSQHPGARRALASGALLWRRSGSSHSHVVAIDDGGHVLHVLQADDGNYPSCSGVRETPYYLYLTSATAPALARVEKSSLPELG